MKNIKRLILVLVAVVCSLCMSFAHPRSAYSRHSALPKEKTGFRLYADFMLTADLADTTGKVKPAFGLALTPGAQITNYFFLGGKVGAMYMIDDLFSFPAAVNVRWTFGRKNILAISQSGGVSYYDDKLYPYVDFYFGGRIPFRNGKCMVCALGYVICPQYNLTRVKDDIEEESADAQATYHYERSVSSWISPQLSLAYPFRFEKKNRIRYKVHRSGPKSGPQTDCTERSFRKSKANEPQSNSRERIEGQNQGPEKTDVQRWKP